MRPAGFIAAIAAMLAAVTAISGDATSRFDVRLARDRQPLHVLNRLAYGPRPGDVEAVRRMGVEAWIRQQLDPAGIPEAPPLAARLQPLTNLTLPTRQLLETVQSTQMFSLSTPVPMLAQLVTPEQFAKLTSGSSSPEERRAAIDAVPAAMRQSVLAAMSTQYPQLLDALADIKREAMQAGVSESQKRLQTITTRLRPVPASELLSPDDLRKFQRGTDEEKMSVLASLTAEKRTQLFRGLQLQVVQTLPGAYRREALAASNPQQGVVNDLIEAKLQRAIYSGRQLEEVLVDFWFNHFNVSTTKAQVRMLLPGYERDAIRPFVLGRFRDMLLATARHPAMLFYLDNYQSQSPRPELVEAAERAAAQTGRPRRVPGINENYGRELMELHTLGVGSGYTQDDVVNLARVFTGWTILDVSRVGEFQFNPQFHDVNEKKVLGHTFAPGGGEMEGVLALDLLSRHPATARFISRKLAQRFVADDPPQALVDRMAVTFTRTDGDLRAVMETMLLSKEFLSEGAWRSKFKSPLEIVASSLRALDAEVTDTTAVAQRIAELGQPLYAKVEPTGYPNTGETWASSAALLGRMNFASALLADQIAGVKANPDAIAAAGVRRAMVEFTGTEASAKTVTAVSRSADGKSPPPALVATVLIGSPDFQKR